MAIHPFARPARPRTTDVGACPMGGVDPDMDTDEPTRVSEGCREPKVVLGCRSAITEW